MVVALQKGVTPAIQASGKGAPVEPLEVDLQGVSFRSRLLEIIEEPATDVDITKADIIVSVGRGIGDKEKIPIIQELADALGGSHGLLPASGRCWVVAAGPAGRSLGKERGP